MSSLRLAILASMREAGITSPQQAPSASPPRKRKSPQPKKDSQPKKKSRPAASPPPPKKSPAKKARPPPSSSSSDDDDDSSDDEPVGLRPAAKLPRAPSLPDLKTPKAPKPKPTPKPKPAPKPRPSPKPEAPPRTPGSPAPPKKKKAPVKRSVSAPVLSPPPAEAPAGGPRPGRSAAKEAARRIASHDYQSPEAKAAAAQAAALAAEKERRRPPRPPPKPRTPQEDQKWAQCDRCGTWRRLPPHVDVDRLPERWFCEMNVWDAARARCDAPEPGATTPEAAAAPLESPGAEPQWVQCDGCQKWRRVPHYVDVASLPDRWFCAMNRWDPLRNSCAAPEETAEEQLAPKKRRGPAPGKPARRAPESAGAKRGRNQYTARRDAEERARAEARAAGRPWPPPGGFRWEPARPSPQRPPRSPPRGPSTNAAQARGGAPYLQAARPPKPKPVWNWVQCERAACRKWRRLPLSLKPEALPDAWVCSMNTWDQRFASCEAAQEDEDAIDDGQSEKKLSFREIIFNAEGKYRPPFSERSAVSSIFAVGTTTVNGRTRDVAAYEDSPVYVDAHAFLSPFPRRSSAEQLQPLLPRRSSEPDRLGA